MLKPNPHETFHQYFLRVNNDEEIRKSYPVGAARAARALEEYTEFREEVRKSFSVYKEDIAKEFAIAVVPEVTPAEMQMLQDAGWYPEVTICKSQTDKNFVFGWACISIMPDGTIPLDWYGDVTPPEELEMAAYAHVLAFRESGVEHEGEATGILIESMAFTKEKMAAIGIPVGIIPEGWWVGYYIPDDALFAKIKSGEYKMFSVQGKAIRTKIRRDDQ